MQGTDSLSDGNKLLIRCAWEGPAFDFAYSSAWAYLGACPSPSPSPPPRLLDNTFASKAELETAVGEYNTDVTAAEDTYGPINNWDVSGITDMSHLFQELGNFNADISSWDTSGVTTMEKMFRVRALSPTSTPAESPSLDAACAVAPAHRPLTSLHAPPPAS